MLIYLSNILIIGEKNMGVSAGTSLALNISEIVDLISVIVNFLGLLFFALGEFASSIVGIMILILVVNAVKPIFKDWVLGKVYK